MNTANPVKSLKVDLAFYKAKREIILVLSLNKNGIELNKSNLIDAIAKENFGEYFLFDEVIEEVLALDEIDEQHLYSIAERRDCNINIQISENEMEAYLSIDRAYGGSPPTVSLINLQLNNLGIKHGLLYDSIEESLWKGEVQSVLIAKGDPPVNQIPTKFEYLGPPLPTGKPRMLDDGQVDFAQLDTVNSVEKGAPVMKRVVSPKGQIGKNIFGHSIPFESFKERAFGMGKNVHIDVEDPNLMVASASGQPIERANCVNIEPVLDLDAIDQSTGNLAFDGTVRVENHIAGFEVDVSGDLIVNGTVEAYQIKVRGNTILKSGIKGHNRGHISGSGTLLAKFVESCLVDINKDIRLIESSINSHVSSLSNIIVGEGGGKGQIIGGKVNAHNSIIANIAGASAETYTILDVGSNPRLNKQLNELRATWQTLKKEFDETIKNIIYLKMKQVDGELRSELEQKREELLLKINFIKEEIQQLESKIRDSHLSNPFIHIKSVIYPGTVLIISGVSRLFREKTLGGKYMLQDGEVRMIA